MKTIDSKNLVLLFMCLGLFMHNPVYAQHLPFQGKLFENGQPVDTLKTFQFSIASGSIAWSETQMVQVNNGLYAVVLGADTILPDSLFKQQVPLNLIIHVNGSLLDSVQIYPPIEADPTVPKGIIVMWSGSIGNIPLGWVLCDGVSGTPDLRDKFIVGAGDSYAVDSTGGEAEHTLIIEEMPAHTHSYRYFPAWNFSGDSEMGAKGNPDDNHQTGSQGGNLPHENRPPYYALAYIMKL